MSHIEFTRTAPDGQELFYQGWIPQGEAKAVVCLVHGLGEHSGRYAYVARMLNDAGYVLLGYDQRGHGKTPGAKGVTPPYDRLLDDIGMLLDEAATRFPGAAARARFLYGHSMGGNLVLNYALQRQASARSALAGVVATSPALRTAAKPPAVKVAAGKVLYRLAPNTVMPNGLDLSGLARDPAVIDAYTHDPLVHDRMSARLGLDVLQNGQWALAYAAEFPPIPLLLVHGTADRLTSAPACEEFASTLARAVDSGNCGCDCTLKLWPGYYHETQNEPEKDQVLCYMIDWLDEMERRSHR